MARGQDWSDQGISPDEKNPALGTRHREPANKGVVEAAGRSLWRGRLSEPSSRPKFQFCWGYGGVRIPASTFFLTNNGWRAALPPSTTRPILVHTSIVEKKKGIHQQEDVPASCETVRAIGMHRIGGSLDPPAPHDVRHPLLHGTPCPEGQGTKVAGQGLSSAWPTTRKGPRGH